MQLASPRENVVYDATRALLGSVHLSWVKTGVYRGTVHDAASSCLANDGYLAVGFTQARPELNTTTASKTQFEVTTQSRAIRIAFHNHGYKTTAMASYSALTHTRHHNRRVPGSAKRRCKKIVVMIWHAANLLNVVGSPTFWHHRKRWSCLVNVSEVPATGKQTTFELQDGSD